MLSLHTNTASLTAQNAIGRTQSALSTSQTRLSTGFRVNSAMDDAAGLQIATRLEAQTRGMTVAMRNAQNGISMLQTAEGALEESINIMLRMKDLATEAASDTSNTEDRAAISSELAALEEELTNIFTNTAFGTRKLFNNAGGDALTAATTLHIGASADETMTLTGVGTIPTDFLTGITTVADAAGGAAAITTINDKIKELSTFRSGLGAVANRLDHTYNNLANMTTNTNAAEGRIMDVDFASESANMTTRQMLLQAGTAMLKQSNSMSQLALSLLQ